MTHNGQFCQKSGLDWLKMANFGHFVGFSIFCPKSGSDWLGMANFTSFTTFPIFLPPKCLIFGESQKFLFLGRYIGNFLEFFNFSNHFTQSSSKWHTMANFATKVAWMSSKWAILVKFQQKLKFSVEFWPICTKPSEQGSILWASQNESKECYAMIKTDESPNISAESWPICTKPQNRARFSKLDKMSPRSAVLWSKLMET